MKNWVLLFLVIAFFSCKEKKVTKEEAKYIPKLSIEVIEKLVHYNSDSLFIGGVSKLEIIEKDIFFVDYSVNKIFRFSDDLKYISSYGREGNGPDEFIRTPKIASYNDTLIVMHDLRDELEFYDKNFNLVRNISYPRSYMTWYYKPVFIKDRVLISALSEETGSLKEVDHIYTAVIIDKKGNVIRNISKFNELYNNNNNTYVYVNKRSCISECFDNSFLIKQKADLDFQQYDYDGNLIKTIYYKPRFYKTPPDIKFGTKYKSTKDYYDRYASKVTHFRTLYYDKKTNLIYVNYLDLFPDQYKTRTHLDANNYLMILDSEFNCVFDDKINGVLMDVEDGIIYLMTENSGEKFEITKLKVKLNEK